MLAVAANYMKGDILSIRKTLVVAGAASAVGVASLLGANLAVAATDTTSGGSLVDKIASTFKLNKEEVQKVFDTERSEREAEIKAKVEENLSQAVKDGKITEEQKAKILAKQEELRSEREANKDSFKDLTVAERRAKMKEKRAELDAWTSENNIPDNFLRYVVGGPHGRMGGPGHLMHDSDGELANPEN